MGSSIKPVLEKYTAAESLQGFQYRFVQLADSDGLTVELADGTKTPVGVLMTQGNQGDLVEVAIDGGAIVRTAEAITEGQFIGPNSEGLAIISTGIVGGYSMQSADANASMAVMVERSAAGTGTDGGGPYNGFSRRFNETVALANNAAAINYILDLGYAGPLVSLSGSPSAATLREKGDEIAEVDLSAVTTKRTNPITSVVFKRGSTTIATVGTPDADGGTETFTDADPFSDNRTYSAEVGDGTSTVTSSINYSFVYPYFYGVGAPGLNVAAIQALTKSIRANSNSVAFTSSPSGQVYYFAYPSAYGALTSILDTNGFETISDYTRTTRTFVGLDGTSQSYYVYEYNNVTTQTSFTNTFKK